MAYCNTMICQQVTLSGDAEWPKVADAVIEAREITRNNFGWAYVESEGGRRAKFEVIQCRGCTMRRAGGTPLLLFLERHHL